MANEYRGEGNVIAWTNNLTAGSGDVDKGTLVHIGNNRFGVAVDDIEFGEEGNLIVVGYFTDGSAIISTTVTQGARLVEASSDIKAVANLTTEEIAATVAQTIKGSNLVLLEDITGSSAAQSFDYKLTG